MNRIGHLLSEPDPANTISTPATVAETPQCACWGDAGAHAFFVPLHYERNYAYPLIVWLHGPQDDQHQIKRIMPLVSLRNYVAVAPRGTLALAADDEREGFGWSQEADHIALAEYRILDAIETARERFHIAPARIFLAGLACGGTMAFRAALDYPMLIAGVLSIGGQFPSGQAPLRRLDEVRRLRVFLASGRDSMRYPPEAVCRDLRLFHSAGMSVDLRQYPCDDDVTTQMLSDMDRWIMHQFQPAGVEAAEIEAGLGESQVRRRGGVDP